jgi:hypothetical protein
VSEFKVLAGAALNVGVGPVEIKEIVYQSVAYVGMGRAFDFVHSANEPERSGGSQRRCAGTGVNTARASRALTETGPGHGHTVTMRADPLAPDPLPLAHQVLQFEGAIESVRIRTAPHDRSILVSHRKVQRPS